VDDNDASREIIEKQVIAQGFEVIVVKSGKEALRCFNNHEVFDAIILDWKMPEMDGIETLREIQSLNLDNSPFVVMATAYDSHDLENELKLQKLTATNILTKPFNASSLWNALNRCFDTLPTKVKECPEPEVLSDKVSLAGIHVLLVEDNQFNQELALELLQLQGMTVELAENGLEAVELVEKDHHYDVVLMDCQMPVMDGYTATKKIREKWGNKLPIIAMTANVMAEDIERATASGMNDYIAKPVNVAKMMATIAKWTLKKDDFLGEATELEPKVKKEPANIINMLPGAEHLNIQMGLQMLEGNSELYTRLLSRFRENFSDSVTQLDDFLESNEIEEAKRLAHTIKGTSANIGTVSLHEIAAKIEKFCYENEVQQAQALVAGLQLSLDNVLKEIDDYLIESSDELGENSEQATEVSSEKFEQLLQTLKDHLENYDSNSEASFLALLSVMKPEDKQKLDKVASAIESYDFEQALTELTICYTGLE